MVMFNILKFNIFITGYCVRLRLLTWGQLTDPSFILYALFIKITTIRETIETIFSNNNEANTHKS